MDWNWKNWANLFTRFNAMPSEIKKKTILWLVLVDEICLIFFRTSQEYFVSARGSLLVSVMTSAQNWAKRATLVILNFAILARLNLARFYFRDFTRQSLCKKALDFAIKAFSTWFYFFKRLNFLKYRGKMKQEKRIWTLFYNRRHSQGMELSS